MAAVGSVFFSERDEYIAAVVAAPAAADMPAMMAKVVFDMIAVGDEKDLGQGRGHNALMKLSNKSTAGGSHQVGGAGA